MDFGWYRNPAAWEANLKSIPVGDARGKGRPKTTWIYKPWGFWELIAASDIAPAEVYTPKPKGYRRSETIPEHSMALENMFIIATAAPPILLHCLSYHLFPNWKWSFGFAFLVYHIGFIRFAVKMIKRMHYWMAYYGTFNEEGRARDMAPDSKVKRLALAVYIYANVRVLGAMIMGYDKNAYPLDGVTVWSPLKVSLWMVALDYFFYCYHRSCHQVPWLWWIHRGHHATKAPTPLLAILADDVQEVLEILLIPAAASLTVPLTWPEGWFCACTMIYIEAMGHSGIRAYFTHPFMGKLLRWVDMDLSIEDHDLHHRNGRGGQAYGKQTRIFDKLFNTNEVRVETSEAEARAKQRAAKDVGPV